MEFIEAPSFTRYLPEYIGDDDFKEFQRVLTVNPLLGNVIPGTGGFRKIRWSDPRRGKGKRGGLRIIYFYFPDESQIWLLTIYGKNEADDLTPDMKRTLRASIKEEVKNRSLRRRYEKTKARHF